MSGLIIALLLVIAILLIFYAVHELFPTLRLPAIGRQYSPRIALPTALANEQQAAATDESRTRAEQGILVLISLVAAFVFYLPFVVHAPSFAGIPFNGQSMDRIYGMWDGPLWVTPAATLWDTNLHNPVYSWWGAPPKDYAERFPAFPLAIRLLSPLLGYWKGALAINIIASTLVTLFLYAFLRRYSSLAARSLSGRWGSAAFWIAAIAIFWPPRGFMYRYVIMSEPLFILGLLGAVYFYKSSRYTLCGLFGALAVASRPNSFIIIAVFALVALGRAALLWRRGERQRAIPLLWLLLMPATLVAIFIWHQMLYGDWLASIHSGTFVHPQATLYPSLTFFGIGDEGVPYLFLLVLAGIVELARRRQWALALLSLSLYLPSLFVSVDVSRYLLPILPFAFYLAGDVVFAARALRAALVLSLPLVYTYAWVTLLYPGYQAPFAALRALLP